MRTYPNNLIGQVNKETKTLFEKILGKEKDAEINIVIELNKITKPIGGFFQKQLTYQELLELIAKNQKIDSSNLTKKEIEERIMIKRFNENFESLTEDEKQKFQNELSKELEKQGLDSAQIKSLSTIGALTAASASGFTMYIMATTIVGGITGILGITLPFVFYTGMSSILSVVTGPIGWTLGLGYLAYKFKDESFDSVVEKFSLGWKSSKNFIAGDFERASFIISIICSVRILNNEKVTQKVKVNKDEISNIEIKRVGLKNENNIIDNIIKEKEIQLNQIHHDLNNKLGEKVKIETNIKEFDKKLENLHSEILVLESELI